MDKWGGKKKKPNDTEGGARTEIVRYFDILFLRVRSTEFWFWLTIGHCCRTDKDKYYPCPLPSPPIRAPGINTVYIIFATTYILFMNIAKRFWKIITNNLKLKLLFFFFLSPPSPYIIIIIIIEICRPWHDRKLKYDIALLYRIWKCIIYTIMILRFVFAPMCSFNSV